MKRTYLLVLVLLATTLASAVAQSRQGPRKPGSGGNGRSDSKSKGSPKPPPEYSPIITPQANKEEASTKSVFVGKVKLKKPVLVYYAEPEPGQSVQQLVMAEANLSLLKTLNLEQIMTRREVFVDGLGNLPLPGNDASKYRLIGTSVVAEETRRPAGDGRSFYSRLKVPSSGLLYVVLEPAEEYRHFVKGPQKNGAALDFHANGLPGIDSVRAVYTLRKTSESERGAGTGETIR
jgi:hypothetical protein